MTKRAVNKCVSIGREFNNNPENCLNRELNGNGRVMPHPHLNFFLVPNRYPCVLVYRLSKEVYCHDKYLIVVFFHSCHLKIQQNIYKLKFRLPSYITLPYWIAFSVSKRTERFCLLDRPKPLEKQELKRNNFWIEKKGFNER